MRVKLGVVDKSDRDVSPTIRVVAESGLYMYGFTPNEAYLTLESMYSLGTQNKASYVVELTPLSSKLKSTVTFFETLSKMQLGLLATEVEFPIAPLNFEQKRVGGTYVNVFQDVNYPSFSITFLETKNRDIIRSLLDYRNLVLSDDGTSIEPYYYAIELSISLFDVQGSRDNAEEVANYIVAISADTLNGLGAKNVSEVVEIPITFNILDPYM